MTLTSFSGSPGSNVGNMSHAYTHMKFSSSGDYSVLSRLYINKHVALMQIKKWEKCNMGKDG